MRDVGETSCASQVQILNEDFVDAFHSEHSNIHMNGNVIPFKGNLIVKVIIFLYFKQGYKASQHCKDTALCVFPVGRITPSLPSQKLLFVFLYC